jgi:phosphate/sulfate permease
LNDPVNLVDPEGLVTWGTVGQGALAVLGGASAVAAGAAVSSTPTIVGQVAGVALALGGSASVSYGVSQIITGITNNEIPFMGTKEAIIRNTTCGLTRKNLLAANDLLDMIPGIAAGRLDVSNSKLSQVISFVQHGLSIGKSVEQIQSELEEAGWFAPNPCR